MKSIRSEKGGILVFTLITVFLLSILGLGIMPLTTMEYQASVHFVDYEKAYYLAEAGMEEAIAYLSQGDWDYEGSTDYFQGIGSYSVAVYRKKDSVREIISIGKVGNITRKIKAIVENQKRGRNLSTIATEYALFSNESMSLDKGARINGNININGDFKVKINQFFGQGEMKAITINNRDNIYEVGNFQLELGNPEDINDFNIQEYINTLQSNQKYTNHMESISKAKHSTQDHPKIFIGDHLESNTAYYGIVVVNSKDVLEIKSVKVYGVLIVNAPGIKNTGHGLEVYGSMICTGKDNTGNNNGNPKLYIEHKNHIERIKNYNEALEEPLNYLLTKSPRLNNAIVIKEWREMDE